MTPLCRASACRQNSQELFRYRSSSTASFLSVDTEDPPKPDCLEQPDPEPGLPSKQKSPCKAPSIYAVILLEVNAGRDVGGFEEPPGLRRPRDHELRACPTCAVSAGRAWGPGLQGPRLAARSEGPKSLAASTRLRRVGKLQAIIHTKP